MEGPWPSQGQVRPEEPGHRMSLEDHRYIGGAGEPACKADPDQPPLSRGPGEPPLRAESTDQLRSTPECPICYVPYDNVFKTPMLLCCAHTFCMECLARMCLFLKQLQVFSCPFCRTEQVIPHGGVPKLPTNEDILVQLGTAMQIPQEVWQNGHELCWIKSQSSPTGQVSETLVTVQLLNNPQSPRSQPEDLVAVGHTTSALGCRTSYKSLGNIFVVILTLISLLFAAIFIPLYLRQ